MSNRLNDSVKEESKPDNLTVHADVMAIAWQCLKREYKPQSANYEDVLKAIASPNEDDDDKKDKAKVRLKYLENRLRLIRTKEPGYKVLFDLDPLAEYLAGLYLVDCYGEDEEKWRELLAEVDSKPGAPEAIKGFLLAVRDCYLAKVPDAKVTDFVPEELGRRTDLDPEKVKEAQLKQRIQRLKFQLSVPDVKDRSYAMQELEEIGPAAKAAVPDLIKLLKDKDEQICQKAWCALVKIGSAAVSALAEMLKDENVKVRRAAVCAIEAIGSEAKVAVPALIEALKDENEEVRWYTVIALGKIGIAAKDAVDSLIEALKDKETGVRSYAAFALGRMGSEARKAIPALIEALEKDESGDVFIAAAEALEAIGFDLGEIKGEVQIGEIKGETKEVVSLIREKQRQDLETRRQNANGNLLTFRLPLSANTPPQKDPDSTGSEIPHK